ncbi:hypothetical protein VOLCADRAFT_86255, partial [Volvox carteri f. nagariensis]
FTVPSEFRTELGEHGDQQLPRRGPRGGKRPLRPRQQQLCALEAELEQKLRDLKAAQEEHDRLQQRAKVLEVVLPIREQQVQLLKQRRQVVYGRQQPAHVHKQDDVPSANAVRITKLQPCVSNGGLPSGSESPSAADGTLELGPKSAETCHRPAALARAIQVSIDYVKVMNHANTFTSGQVAVFTSVPAHGSVPPHLLRHMVNTWKQWVREAGLVLHAYDARPHDPGPQLKLAQLYEQQLTPTFRAIRLDYPFFLSELMYLNFETGERGEPPPDSFWVPVVQGLRFSPEQIADAVAALALYKERTAKALEERRILVAKLDSVLAADRRRSPWEEGPGANQGQSGPLKCCDVLLELDYLTAQLYRNVMNQGGALEAVKDFMGSNLFSLVQVVRGSVLSYPYFPDAIAILNCLSTMSPFPVK